jgi:xylulokinase
MARVAGVDSSTQSTKVLVVDADSGDLLEQASAPHPEGTEVPPDAWASALDTAGKGLLDTVEAVAVGGQQHGMVVLDDQDEVVRPALLWNDTRSADAALELIDELGGPGAWAEAVGLVPVASFTVTKLRWLASHEPELATRVVRCVLPHDWLTGRLCVDSDGWTTDRGDASGTGYWSPSQAEYRTDLLELAFGRSLDLPRVAGPAEVVGHTESGAAVAAGTGDNMAAALGTVAAARRRGGVARHQRHRVRPLRDLHGRCHRTGRRVRRRAGPVPAVGGDAQRRPRADRHGAHAGGRPLRAGRPGHVRAGGRGRPRARPVPRR